MLNRKTTIYDCSVIELPKIHNRAGNITPVEGFVNTPFKIQRIYYLYDIPGGESRGGHAHKKLQQFIIAASGSFDILVDDGKNRKTVHLNRPYYALHIVSGIWRELMNFSSGAVCLVLASEKYDNEDYIRDYQEFISYSNNKYNFSDMNNIKIQEIVISNVKSLVDTFSDDKKIEVNLDTVLFGTNSNIDSLSLVSVIVDLETTFSADYDIDISLTDDRAMMRKKSPFDSIRSLIAYIDEIVNEK